ncbi:hypothetical protein F1559_005180 [Cyanidiococcus yangmingshanensis]|uniref:Uncharacterized protein n=1 Tax=Cyanidiococcus yangmingshanensis TaxID=2690220 RepID=A0A7J7IQN6_9RHOD|nr:hypothetical protein F1559_005180 [Cyanidiococcus yangmingshanensis]
MFVAETAVASAHGDSHLVRNRDESIVPVHAVASTKGQSTRVTLLSAELESNPASTSRFRQILKRSPLDTGLTALGRSPPRRDDTFAFIPARAVSCSVSVPRQTPPAMRINRAAFSCHPASFDGTVSRFGVIIGFALALNCLVLLD